MKKLVSALVLNYEVSLYHRTFSAPEAKSNARVQFRLLDLNAFTVENSWFFRQRGLNVGIERRNSDG